MAHHVHTRRQMPTSANRQRPRTSSEHAGKSSTAATRAPFENRGVPGSSPGLAIPESSCTSTGFFRRRIANREVGVGAFGGPWPIPWPKPPARRSVGAGWIKDNLQQVTIDKKYLDG